MNVLSLNVVHKLYNLDEEVQFRDVYFLVRKYSSVMSFIFSQFSHSRQSNHKCP
jgi:hypothetical protein